MEGGRGGGKWEQGGERKQGENVSVDTAKHSHLF